MLFTVSHNAYAIKAWSVAECFISVCYGKLLKYKSNMKSELAKNLKEVLENMSQEQFDKEWGEIVQMGFEGISFKDYLEVQELLYNANQFGIAFAENINNQGMTKIECYIAGFIDGAKRHNLP